MENWNEYLASLVLNAIGEVGPVTFRRLKEHFRGNFSAIFHASAQELSSVKGVSRIVADRISQWQQHFDLEYELQQIETLGIRFLTQSSTDYPILLKKIYDLPIGLYVRGNHYVNNKKCVAIIGARKPSAYGLKIAREFAFELAKIGFTVVSGMALGIDAAAHEGALASQKEMATIAVLGSGVDVVYPRENHSLYRKIMEQGSIISEFSLGKKADKVTFPVRNRIIAGMCAHLIVIESDEHGGSILTAHMANEYNRNVMAVPGRVDMKTSRGCHNLIREGAALVGSFDQVLEELNYEPQQGILNLGMEILQDPVEFKIIEKIREHGNVSANELSELVGISMHYLLPKLQLLELRQIVRRNAAGNYEC